MPGTGRSRKLPKPEFFIDRDLGRYKIPNALTQMGFVVHPLYVVYGPEAEQSKEDPDWIPDAAKRGWVILCRDKLRHEGERPAIEKSKARVFRVGRSARNADEQIVYIKNNIQTIVRRAQHPGPYIYRIDRKGLEKVYPVKRK